jgi:RNA polymerase sigma factor (sigma-70 family)
MLSADEDNEFCIFYKETAPRLYLLAYKLWAGQQADAEDCLQRAYLNALRHWKTVGGLAAGQRYSWMRTTVINEAKQQWRAPHRSRETGWDSDLDDALQAPVHRSLDERFIGLDRYRDACRAIIGLGGRTSEVMVMHCIEGLEIPEVAETLEIAPATVRALLSKGRKRLRALIPPAEGTADA